VFINYKKFVLMAKEINLILELTIEYIQLVFKNALQYKINIGTELLGS